MEGQRRRLQRPARTRRGAARTRFVSAAAIVAAAIAVACKPADLDATPTPEAWVTIRDQRVAAEVADTREEQALGLGERDSLSWGNGMLFVYPRPGFYGFWMKGMRFAIDIVWIRDGRIVDITHRIPNLPGGDPGPTYRPRALTDTVLEVPAGYAQALGWRVGDLVEVERTRSPAR